MKSCTKKIYILILTTLFITNIHSNNSLDSLAQALELISESVLLPFAEATFWQLFSQANDQQKSKLSSKQEKEKLFANDCDSFSKKFNKNIT